MRKTIRTLEFNKIADLASELTVSNLGREILQSELPCTDFSICQKKLDETEAAEGILTATGYYPIPFFPDIRNVVLSLSAVYALEAKELLDIAVLLKACRVVKHLIGRNEHLEKYAYSLADFEYIENEICRCIVSEDEIADKASAALYRIRCDIKQTEERIKDKISNYIKGNSQKYLQEPIFTIRNGRYVIPVKAEFKNSIPGLIHDQSASGQTFFIEPSPVVELGNKFRTLLLEEQKEVQRILSSLTALISPSSELLLDSIRNLSILDSIFAKAAFSKRLGGIRPKLNEHSYICLINAKHPLLSPKSVVPISVWIGDSFNTLIITGPNTGGKTVSLKTVGLLSLMAQCGYFIPADIGSEMPVFKTIFADIGDEQSIEQNLSTFSSHMRNIVSILKEANEDSLVLLDELGAGTDPYEGAALAQAILQYLNDSSAITFATTHYSEIKSFALATPGMENASMEFDVDKMAPTYRMHIGIPGRSNAFEISARLGLNAQIIHIAKGFLTTNQITLEEILAKSEKNRLETERTLSEANKILDSAQKKEKELQQIKDKLEKSSAEYKAKAREEARLIIRNAKEQADELINELRNTQGLDSGAVERKANKIRSRLREFAEEFEDNIVSKENIGFSPIEITVGNKYYSAKLLQNVEALKIPDSKNEVLVQAGSIKIKLPISDLSAVVDEGKKVLRTVSGSKINTEQMKMELDLRGSTVDDACLEIERYIDMCMMHSRKEFVIIHGKGTGALREGVHSFLKKCKSVLSFHIGAYGEGDAGVTVVKLKSE